MTSKHIARRPAQFKQNATSAAPRFALACNDPDQALLRQQANWLKRRFALRNGAALAIARAHFGEAI